MGAAITLNIRDAQRKPRQLCFDAPAVVSLGRGQGCTVLLTDTAEPPAISRRHCELDLAPPQGWVRDLGSRNGTFLNGKRLLCHPAPDSATTRPGAPVEGIATPLVGGDVLRLGDFEIEVVISYRLVCPNCNTSWAQALQGPAPSSPSRLCDACSKTMIPSAGSTPAAGAPFVPGYEMDRELGRGAMGIVHLACRDGEPIAVKTILPSRSSDASARERFIREVMLSIQLQHPNIVRVLDAGLHGDLIFLASEYCEGGTVADLVARSGGTLEPLVAVSMMTQVLTGLEYAHHVSLTDVPVVGGHTAAARGLIHRDLKPQNLLLGGKNGRVVKIADYGLAKAFALAGISGGTNSGTVGGTPAFMSRWQASNYKYAGPEVDVWSAAATLYYLLTGTPPRDFSTRASLFEIVMREDCVPVRKRRPDVPAKLADLLDEALNDTEPPAFPSAEGLRVALAAAV